MVIVFAASLAGCGAGQTTETTPPETAAMTETSGTEAAGTNTDETEAAETNAPETKTAAKETELSETEPESVGDTGVTVRVGSLSGPTSMGLVSLMNRAKNSETANLYEFTMASAADEINTGMIEALGIVPKAAIAQKAIPFCNITCITGTDMKTALSGYLEVLGSQNAEAIGGTLPGDDFYYNAE